MSLPLSLYNLVFGIGSVLLDRNVGDFLATSGAMTSVLHLSLYGLVFGIVTALLDSNFEYSQSTSGAMISVPSFISLWSSLWYWDSLA